MKSVWVVLSKDEGYLLFKQAYATEKLARDDIEVVQGGVYLPTILLKEIQVIGDETFSSSK